MTDASIAADQTARLWRGDEPGPVRSGSEQHKSMFCRMLLDTFNPYKPAVIDWPKLDDEARERWADKAGHVDHGRVEGDGVAEVIFVFDHLDEEGLAAGHIEGVDNSLEGAERDDLVDGDDLCERECGHGERLNARENLCPDEKVAAVDAVDEDSGKGSEEEGGDLSGKAYDTEQER